MHVTQRGWSADTSLGRKTISEQPQREDLLPPHVVRQMRRNDAVLFHGTLPPVHLRLVRWWKDKDLRALVPHGEDGKPLPAPTTGTCPVSSTRTSQVESVIDPAVVAEQVASMPKPKPTPDKPGLATTPRRRRHRKGWTASEDGPGARHPHLPCTHAGGGNGR